jgi:hypothetical protein
MMPTKQEIFTCPHCGAELQAFELPEAGGWDQKYHLACFNNDCPYYRGGWSWMLDHYNAKVSYRYRLDPQSGKDSPIAVWSETALVDRILKKDVKPANRTRPKKSVKKEVKPANKTRPKKSVKKAAKPAKKRPQKSFGNRVKPKSRTK